MPVRINFRKKLAFAKLPKCSKVVRVCLDWNGQPLVLLADDERPPWINAPPDPPGGHQLLHWEGAVERILPFEQSIGFFTHVQPLGDGWLLSEPRGGRATVYGRSGELNAEIKLGDAIKDVQTTADGKLWVAYFDEGVFGEGIGRSGLVCFDWFGKPIFSYSDFAKQHQLPLIHDCYAINAPTNDELWLSYYSDFPLVRIRNFQMEAVWKDFGCMQGAFGLTSEAVVFPKCYTRVNREKPQLMWRTLSELPQTEQVDARDNDGVEIGGPFRATARGQHFCLWTEGALYEMV
jgi:hypothetical protein